jgi:glycosyltransferase involved in cell wall biosynthesis
MRTCDLFILPSIKESFGVVCAEAMASGCVPLISDVRTDVCYHQSNSLVHSVGDGPAKAEHINLLHRDRAMLTRLRPQGLKDVPSFTWATAGRWLLHAYESIIARNPRQTYDA